MSARLPAYKRWGLRISSVALLIALWEWYALQQNNTLIFPTFSATLDALFEQLQSTELWNAIWLSHQAVLLGFGLALSIGIPLGLTSGYWPFLGNLIDPYVRLLLVVPKSALVPIFILALGIDLTARAWVIFLFSISYIVINVQAGVTLVDRTLVEMAHSFSASNPQIFRKILLPGAFPAIFAGTRIGLGRSIAGMVIVELLLTAVGVGRLIISYRTRFDPANAYAVVLVIVIESLILSGGLRWIERRVQWVQ